MTFRGALLAALFMVGPAWAQSSASLAEAPDPSRVAEPSASSASTADGGAVADGRSPEAGPADAAVAAPGDDVLGAAGSDAPGSGPAAGEAAPGPSDAGAPAPPSTAGRAPGPSSDEQALYDRLLGASGAGSDGDAVAPPAAGLGIEAPSVPGWLWVVGILAGVGLILLRSRSLKALRGPDAIEVISRSQLGKDGSLAVVEVAEADGEKRRLLVGFGGGAPRLVADLGRPFPELPERLPASLAARAGELGPRPVAAASGGEAPPAAGTAPRANAAGAWARAVREAGGGAPAPTPSGALLERRHDLIEEVLAEREDDDVRGVGG